MIEKMANALGVSPKVMMISLVVFAVLFVLIYIKITIDEKKGVDSQEKADIRKIITNLVPEGSQYTAVYAHSKEVYGSRRMRREVYHYYAVGFIPSQTDHLWVVPVGVEHGKIVYTQAVRMSAENLSYVGGNEMYLELHFPDRKDAWILTTEASNTKMGKECQVNIQQKEEADAFHAFAKIFQEQVNRTLGVNRKGRRV